jgi:IclR helix-turn-helix domain
MTNDEQLSIRITLSPAQIIEVIRAASGSRVPSISTLIADPNGCLLSDTDDPRLSRSLVRGLSLLTGFGPDREERGIVELAGELGMSPSTAHRYALTLMELGLLDRCPKTRKYRLPRSDR